MTLTQQIAVLTKQVAEMTATLRVQNRMVSMDEAAKLLGISYRTVRRMVHEGEIPHTRIGRLVRIDLDVITPQGHQAAPAGQPAIQP